jgi:hypothetical protein
MNHLNRFIKPLKYTLQANEAFVCINEEFGYRNWFWFPQFSQKELIRFWKQLDGIDKFNFRSKLPGKIILASAACEHYNENLMNLWFYLVEGKMCSTSFIFDDDNSYLVTHYPRRVIFHKKYFHARLLLERDIEEQLKEKK